MKKIIILILICLILLPLNVLAQSVPPPPQPEPGDKPNNCGERCALIINDGYNIILWDKNGAKIYTYAAISKWTPTWFGAGKYIYKRNDVFYSLIGYEPAGGYSEGETVITTPAKISVYKHFKTGEHDLSIAAWDDTPTLERGYPIVKEGTFPPTGVIEKDVRYSFRIGISGTVKLEGDSGNPLSNTTILLYLDNPKGPPIMETQTNIDGTFLIARATGDEIWLNQNNINKIFLYAQTEINGKKYDNCGNDGQGMQVINFPTDFRPHEEDSKKALVIYNVELKLKETPEFCRTARKQLTPGQELTGGSKEGALGRVINFLRCMLFKFFVGYMYFLGNFGGYFLRRNY